MHCIETMHPGRMQQPRLRLTGALTLITLLTLLGACGTPPAPSPRQGDVVPGRVGVGKGAAAKPPLPAAKPARDWNDYRQQAALRMVAANPNGCYMSVPPDPLLAIPVLEINLEADGRIRNIVVMREPRQALDTIQLAIDAVRRAGPFGSVAHLPRPWKFVEVFLFDDERRFKPRSLDTDH